MIQFSVTRSPVTPFSVGSSVQRVTIGKLVEIMSLPKHVTSQRQLSTCFYELIKNYEVANGVSVQDSSKFLELIQAFVNSSMNKVVSKEEEEEEENKKDNEQKKKDSEMIIRIKKRSLSLPGGGVLKDDGETELENKLMILISIMEKKPLLFSKNSQKGRRSQAIHNYIKCMIHLLLRRKNSKLLNWKILNCVSLLTKKQSGITLEVIKSILQILNLKVNESQGERTHKRINNDIVYNLLRIIKDFSKVSENATFVRRFGMDIILKIMKICGLKKRFSLLYLTIEIFWNVMEFDSESSDITDDKGKIFDVLKILFIIAMEIDQEKITSLKLMKGIFQDLQNDVFTVFLVCMQRKVIVNGQHIWKFFQQLGVLEYAVDNCFNYKNNNLSKLHNYETLVLLQDIIFQFALEKEVMEDLYRSVLLKNLSGVFRAGEIDSFLRKKYIEKELKEIWFSSLSVLFIFLQNYKELQTMYCIELFNFLKGLKHLREMKLEEKVIVLLLECSREKAVCKLLLKTNLIEDMMNRILGFRSESTELRMTQPLKEICVRLASWLCLHCKENRKKVFEMNGIVQVARVIKNDFNKKEFLMEVINFFECSILGSEENLNSFLEAKGLDFVLRVLEDNKNDSKVNYFVIGFILSVLNNFPDSKKLREAIKKKAKLVVYLLMYFHNHLEQKATPRKKSIVNKEVPLDFEQRLFLLFREIGYEGLNYLNLKERQILTKLKPFEKYIELNIWRSMKRGFAEQNLEIIGEDKELMEERLLVLENLNKEIDEENRNIRKQIDDKEQKRTDRMWSFIKKDCELRLEEKRNKKSKRKSSLPSKSRISKKQRMMITRKFLEYSYFNQIQ